MGFRTTVNYLVIPYQDLYTRTTGHDIKIFTAGTLRSRVRIEVRPTENDSTQLYKNGDISVVITRSYLKFGR